METRESERLSRFQGEWFHLRQKEQRTLPSEPLVRFRNHLRIAAECGSRRWRYAQPAKAYYSRAKREAGCAPQSTEGRKPTFQPNAAMSRYRPPGRETRPTRKRKPAVS